MPGIPRLPNDKQYRYLVYYVLSVGNYMQYYVAKDVSVCVIENFKVVNINE